MGKGEAEWSNGLCGCLNNYGTCKFLRDPISYFFDGRSPSSLISEFLHLAGALMEHFLEGIAPSRLTQMSRLTNTNRLFWVDLLKP